MKLDLFKGRLGAHRFHPMLVHFPGALYPFSCVMDGLYFFMQDERFAFAGFCSLSGALAVGIVAMVYGAIDFLQIDSHDKAWKVAGLHGLANVIWFTAFAILLGYRIKNGISSIDMTYLIVAAILTVGMFVSNYLGAELVQRYKIGIGDSDAQ